MSTPHISARRRDTAPIIDLRKERAGPWLAVPRQPVFARCASNVHLVLPGSRGTPPTLMPLARGAMSIARLTDLVGLYNLPVRVRWYDHTQVLSVRCVAADLAEVVAGVGRWGDPGVGRLRIEDPRLQPLVRAAVDDCHTLQALVGNYEPTLS